MNTFWTAMLLTVAILLSLWGVSVVATFLSEPNTMTVAGGIGLLLAGVVGWHYLWKWMFPSKPKATFDRADVALFALLAFGATACTRVEAGHVGVKVNYSGTDRGVESYPAVTGWVYFLPGASTVFEWPTYMQNAVWSAADNKQSPGNEELCFNSKEGLSICGDFSLAYYLKKEKVPAFYVQFRTDDLFEWTHGYLHNVARDAVNEVASKLAVEYINGEGKEAFITATKERVQDKVEEYGVVLNQFGVVGQLRLPKGVIDSLNAKIAATQNAIRAENELRQAQAEAQKKIATAEGEAASNRLVQATVTPELIRWRTLQILADKWDGRYPTVMAGDGAGGMGLMLSLDGKR